MADAPVVLITGSSGLIGTRLSQELARDHVVVGMDVRPPEAVVPGGHFVETDLIDEAGAERALAEVRERVGERIASVVHLAGYYDFSGEPSPLYDQLTVQGTRRLLRALQGLRVEQFVFASTLLVVKPAEDGDEVLTEESPVEPAWEYPRSKLAAEHVIARERGPIPAVVLRLAGVYDHEGHSLPLAQQVKRIREKTFESYFFPGDADHGQPFLHLDDAARCFRAAIERRAELAPYELFLIGEPEVPSYRDLQDQLGTLIHGREWPTLEVPQPLAKTGAWLQEKTGLGGDSFIKPWMIELADDHYPLSIARARERLGWEPVNRLALVLPFVIGRLKQDPEGWYRENKLQWPE